MKYQAKDQLNGNAVNARHLHLKKYANNETSRLLKSILGIDCIAREFEAASDADALIEFENLIDDGWVGYGERNTERVNASLWEGERWVGGWAVKYAAPLI